jgi:hypothetical protein
MSIRLGIAGIQGAPGDTGEGSFIFARYIQYRYIEIVLSNV